MAGLYEKHMCMIGSDTGIRSIASVYICIIIIYHEDITIQHEQGYVELFHPYIYLSILPSIAS